MDLLNQNIHEFIKDAKHIVFDVRVNKKICKLSSFVPSFVLAWCTFFVWLFPSFILNGLLQFYLSVVLFIVAFIFWFVVVYMYWSSKRYVLTDCGIYVIKGLIFKKSGFVAYNQIIDSIMYVGIFERLCGCGSVIISGNDGNINSGDKLNISGINEYKEIQSYILKHIK